MNSNLQNPDLLAAEGRGFANAARSHDLEGRLEDARISYLKAAEKFIEAALAGDLKDKQMRLDFAKLFYTKAMGLKKISKNKERSAKLTRPHPRIYKKLFWHKNRT